jgi:hypothetical protein
MPALNADLLIEQGADFRFSFVVKTGRPPQPMDLSGYSAKMQLRSDVRSGTALLDLSSPNDGISIVAAEGRLDFFVPAALTRGLDFPKAVYDVLLISDSGDVIRLAQGSCKLSPGVTRD